MATKDKAWIIRQTLVVLYILHQDGSIAMGQAIRTQAIYVTVNGPGSR
jgi:hypothetical protein